MKSILKNRKKSCRKTLSYKHNNREKGLCEEGMTPYKTPE